MIILENSDMPSRFWRLLATPIFNSEEKTRAARFLNLFSLSVGAILVVIILVRLILQSENGSLSLLILGAIVFVLGLVQVMMRRGHVRAASVFLIVSVWVAMTFQAWAADGIRDAAVISYLLIILMASFLLSWREALVVSIVSILATWYFAVLEQNGIRPQKLDEPLNFARDLTAIFIFTGALIYLLVHNLNRSLYEARLELKERLKAEEKLQRQTDYLTTLHQTSLELVHRLELFPLLESILARACHLAETPHGVIDLLLADGSAMRQEMGYGDLKRFNGLLTQRNEGLTGLVWSRGEAVFVDNYPEWEGQNPVVAFVGFQAVLGLPLKSGDAVVGVLAVGKAGSGKTFTPEQVGVLEQFAALASLALDNARLYEQSQVELKERRATETALRASEERFRKIFHASPVAICITSLEEGTLLDANDAYWALSGLDAKTSIGRTAIDLELWDSREDRIHFVDNLIRTRSQYNPNYEFANTSGENKSTIAFYELVQLGEETTILSMFYDVTAQKNAQEALRQSEARTRALLDAIPDMIFEISMDGIFLSYIPSSEFEPAVPPEEFLGKHIEDVFPARISAQTAFALNRALESGQLQAFEYGLPPGEEMHFFEARVSAVSGDSALVMVRDITQRKWVETEREKLINELEGKNAELERFTYTVSHDLKSPLITIKGFLGFLERDAASGNLARLKTDIQRISGATDKMQLLLNELLELSRIGRLINPPQHVPFEEIAREAVELVQGRIRAGGIKVSIQGGMRNIHGDRQRLVEALQNLVDNSAKFMGNQREPSIEIGQRENKGGETVFFVHDNGIGIAPEYFDRIFGLFNKLDANSDGTGVGLALVKRIIDVHGGRIWVESELGKWTTFLFTLPGETDA